MHPIIKQDLLISIVLTQMVFEWPISVIVEVGSPAFIIAIGKLRLTIVSLILHTLQLHIGILS